MSQTGMEQFLDLFGDYSVTDVVKFALAIFFCIMVYKKVKNYLVEKIKVEEERDKNINEALEQTKKYPEYRQQSIEIQRHFQEEIDALKEVQENLAITQQEICVSLKDMQEKQERRDRNKLRDRLLQSYRYYTDKEKNPSQSWTKMESEAFWELFSDYEDAGGDGYMHSEVQPAMNSLKVINN